MNGKGLYLLAFALLGLALLLGAYSLRQGQVPPEPEKVAALPPPPEQHRVWVFREPVEAGAVLTAAMLEQQGRPGPAPGMPVEPRGLLGRVLLEPVMAGVDLDESLLVAPRPLLDALPAGYRALALKVDEVTAVGGHLNTGDRVDVIYYLKANRESGQESTARRLLADVAVLAYGAELIGQAQDKPEQRQERARSVVLAVPEQQVAALLLAESTGSLRLAVLGRREEVQPSKAAVPVSLKALAGVERTPSPAAPAPRLAKQAPGQRVEVFYGEQKAVVTTAR
jgi:pilus assembly protein CpaB